MIRALYCGACRPVWLLARHLSAGAETSREGIELAWARTPESARAAMREQSFDVVLVDGVVGEGDGLDLLADAAFVSARTPVLFFVPHEHEVERMERAFELGARDVLVRPRVSPADLRWAIQKVCRRTGPFRGSPRRGPRRDLSGSTAFRERLERALRRDVAAMAFELHYQPRVDLRTGSVVGAEALLRYSPGDLGPLEPGEVIPLLEAMDEIGQVGEWALREACRVSAECERLGHPLVLGVNVSAHQVEAGRLDRAVERALAETGASAELLELELTEGVLIENTLATRRLLADLRSGGVRVAVDDFGTGYASLRYVKHFPMDVIKIDREFVRGLPDDPENAAITSAIIALAHSLGIEVVAEGVEHPAEEDFLRERRCDYVQGFLRARPMSSEQLLASLRRESAARSWLPGPAVVARGDVG